MWGIIPAAGKGSRIQPLAFSKELLPVGNRYDGQMRRPRAVSDYLMERLVLGGATRICFVISPGKSDILEYYGGSAYAATLCYSVQPQPNGLCDAIFRALPLIDDREPVLVGLPDTIWYPADALRELPDDRLSFLLFPVERPELFDAVVADERGWVREIQVKQADAEVQLDLGRLQNARPDPARAARPVGGAQPRRRIYRHARQRMAGARRSGVERPRRLFVFRCRHDGWIYGGNANVE